jgi:hypothetical protein
MKKFEAKLLEGITPEERSALASALPKLWANLRG